MLHLADLAAPGTLEAERLASEQVGSGLGVVATDAPGFAVVSQTCEIVRSCASRPYVEVCPLIELPEGEMNLVRSGRRGQFVSLPGLRGANVAVDLDRPMTMEKAALVGFQAECQPGVTSEADIRKVADALGRKRGRAAFPDDFVSMMEAFRKRVVAKHRKDTDEGRFLGKVKQVRVNAAPSWTSTQVQLNFMFVFDHSSSIPADADDQIDALIGLVSLASPYVEIQGKPVALEHISAAAYLQSDQLDFDHLSPVAQVIPAASGLS